MNYSKLNKSIELKGKLSIILLLPIAIILLNFTILLNEDSFYEKHLNSEDLPIKDNLILYLTNKANLEPNYTNKETSHLKDVKKLIANLHAILWLSILIILALKLQKKAFIYGSSLTILIIILLSITNFDWLFLKFHELSFNNLNWLLPKNTTLIKLFPSSFFLAALKTILLRSIILSSILLLISSQTLKSSRNNN